MDNYQQPQQAEQPAYQQPIPPQQPMYGQGIPPQQPMYNQPVAEDMSVGEWMVTLLLMYIPIVNLICLIVWAVSSSPNKRSRKNWAIAQFIWVIIDVVIGIIIVVAAGASIASLM